MICKKCGYEFYGDFTHCPRCNVFIPKQNPIMRPSAEEGSIDQWKSLETQPTNMYQEEDEANWKQEAKANPNTSLSIIALSIRILYYLFFFIGKKFIQTTLPFLAFNVATIVIAALLLMLQNADSERKIYTMIPNGIVAVELSYTAITALIKLIIKGISLL